MDLMDIDEDTFIDKNLRMEGVVTEGETAALPDSDTPLRPAERKRFLRFDFEALPRMKLSSGHVTVCVGLLCVVLLLVNMGQLIYHASNNVRRDRLQSSHDALTAQREQLEHRLSEVTREKEQLLETIDKTLQREKVQLLTSFTELVTDCIHIKITTQSMSQKLKTVVQSRGLPCQTGWKKFGDNCYIISTVDKNWERSREACSSIGADLVVIDSQDEQAFVNGLLTSDQNVWIGLSDSHKEGTWMWVDGTPINTTFWESGQPNSYKGFEQDCVETVGKSSGVGEWNDEQCGTEQKFVCEQ